MASINRLAIRGVRSFSPNDEEQAVEFFFPCTMIVGANGCGKTTIIESLKYALTGAFPPGNKSGQAFVHDPRSIGSQTVKAQVKLRFTSRGGNSMVVIRSMELTQKKTTLSFKQLDGALRTLNPETGKIVSLSHKCTELDKQLPQLLGVSKPILEHVLFCHQEDASWPLMEGAVLKKRFDDIFDSTRYTKAIDVFRKTEKELNMKVKDLKADLTGLASHRHAAQNFQRELTQYQEQLEQLDEEKKHLAASIKEAQETQEKAEQIIASMEDLQNEIDTVEQSHVMKAEMVAKQQQILGKDLMNDVESVDQLTKMLQDFDKQVAAQGDRVEDFEEQRQSLEREMAILTKQERKLGEQKARLEASQEQKLARCKERYNKMESMAQAFSLDLQLSSQGGNLSLMDGSFITSQTCAAATTDIAISKEDIANFFDILRSKERELDEAYSECKTRHQAEEDKLVASISDLEARKKSVEADARRVEESMQKAEQEIVELGKELGGPANRVHGRDVAELRSNVEKLTQERERFSNNPRRANIPVEIHSHEHKIDALKRELDDDKRELSLLRSAAHDQSSINVLREQCEKDYENFVELFQDQSYVLQKYNVKPENKPPAVEADPNGDGLVVYVEGIIDALNEQYDEERTKLEKEESNVATSQRNVNERTAIVRTQQQALNSKKEKISQIENGASKTFQRLLDHVRQAERKANAIPPPRDISPEKFFEHLDKRLAELDDDTPFGDDVKIVKKLFKKLKKLARRMDEHGEYSVSCPCCMRDMNSDEAAVFQTQLQNLPEDPFFTGSDEAQLEEYNKQKSMYEKCRKHLSQTMGDLRDYQTLKEDAYVLESDLDKIQDELLSHRNALQTYQSNAKSVQLDVDGLKSLVDVCKQWSSECSRIAEKRLQIKQKSSDLASRPSGSQSGRDLATVEKDIAKKSEEKDRLMNEINGLNKEMTMINNSMNDNATRVAQAEKLLREKEEKYKAVQKATERRKVLTEKIQASRAELSNLKEQVAPLVRKIDNKTRDRERGRKNKEDEVSSSQNMLLSFQGDMKELQRLTNEIDGFAEAEENNDMEQIESEMAKMQKKKDDRIARMKEVQTKIDKVQSQISDQERHKKKLRDNIDVIQTKNEVVELQQQADKLQDELDAIEGSDSAYKNRKRALESKQKHQSELARLEGRWMEVVEGIRSVKRKLSTEEYKDVDEQYRVANIKHVTTQMAAEDLKKYWNAVDKALLKYHSVKIAEINKIIRELWLLTYKGEDITNIEIVSGQDSGSRASRSYNYRVVYTKGGAQLDMRGRCSAGQRVLASIVIRLALAESFGVNCGCIALDEPTVNLDYPNKKGLAVALAQIIASRSQQSNFQLILITHDEDFVAMTRTELSLIANFSMPEKYFFVRRERATDGKYYSKVIEKDLSELI